MMSLWLKLRGERGREAIFVGCVYMPTDSASVSFQKSVIAN